MVELVELAVLSVMLPGTPKSTDDKDTAALDSCKKVAADKLMEEVLLPDEARANVGRAVIEIADALLLLELPGVILVAAVNATDEALVADEAPSGIPLLINIVIWSELVEAVCANGTCVVADTAAEALEVLPDVPSGTWDGAVMAFAAELVLLAEPKPMEVAAVIRAAAVLEEFPAPRGIAVVAVSDAEELEEDKLGLKGIVEAPELMLMESALVDELPAKVILVAAVIAMVPDDVDEELCSGTPVGAVRLMLDVELLDANPETNVEAVTAAEAVLVLDAPARDTRVGALIAAEELEVDADAPAGMVVAAVMIMLLDDVPELVANGTTAERLMAMLSEDVELLAPRATGVATVTVAELDEVPADAAKAITVAAVIKADELLVDAPAASGT